MKLFFLQDALIHVPYMHSLGTAVLIVHVKQFCEYLCFGRKGCIHVYTSHIFCTYAVLLCMWMHSQRSCHGMQPYLRQSAVTASVYTLSSHWASGGKSQWLVSLLKCSPGGQSSFMPKPPLHTVYLVQSSGSGT